MAGTQITCLTAVIFFVVCVLQPILAAIESAPFLNELEQGTLAVPRRCVLFPRRIRPGSSLSVLVLWPGTEARTLRARLTRDGREVASDTAPLPPDTATAWLRMRVPERSDPGHFVLRVEGDLQGFSGGTVFVDEASLVFSSDFLAIVVQTSRPVYMSSQTVRFRVLLLKADAKPYEDPVDVYVVDPDGLIMRRWVSVQNNNGVISHKFRLPRLPKDGEWRIRVRAKGQVQEHPVAVDTYFKPQFEVHVRAPAYLLDSAPDLQALVCARSELQRAVRGNLTLRVLAGRWRRNWSGSGSGPRDSDDFRPRRRERQHDGLALYQQERQHQRGNLSLEDTQNQGDVQYQGDSQYQGDIQYQEGNQYQRDNLYQRENLYQQDNQYQRGNINQQDNQYQRGNNYQQDNQYQRGNINQQDNQYQRGNNYQQDNQYQRGNNYQQDNQYQRGNTYQQDNQYQRGNTYQQDRQYQQGRQYQHDHRNRQPQQYPMDIIWEHTDFLKVDGCFSVSVPLELVQSAPSLAGVGSSLGAASGSLEGVQMRVEAEVTDLLFGETSRGFSHTRLVGAAVQLRFLGARPLVFHPGAIFEGHVVAEHEDNEPLTPERLSSARLRLKASVRTSGGPSIDVPEILVRPRKEELEEEREAMEDEVREEDEEARRRKRMEHLATDDVFNNPEAKKRFRRDGVLSFRFRLPASAVGVELEASYEDALGGVATRHTSAVRFHSPRRRLLHVRSSTTVARVQEYAVMHVSADFPLDSFYYLVMSKGELLFWGEQPVADSRHSVTTFSIPVSMTMTPALRVLVVHIANDGELLADSVEIPVAAFTHYKIKVRMNQGKDPTLHTAEAMMMAHAGSFIGLHAERASAFRMQAGNGISRSRVLLAFLHLDKNGSRSESQVTWRSRDGLMPDRHEFLSSANPGVDANTTLEMAGLGAFTDAFVPRWPRGDFCMEGQVACLTDGCYLAERRCDGRYDCNDGSDENECPMPPDDREYRLTRTSRTTDTYDSAGDDWGWQEMNDEYGGAEFFQMKMPPIADDWFVVGYSVSRVKGFTTLEVPIHFSTERPFMFHLEGPSACRRGEQVGLRALLINNMETEIMALLEIKGAPTHRFVHVEEGGIVSSYGARLEAGDHFHLVYLSPRSQQHVDIPITPAIAQGDISIEIAATTQIGGFRHIHTMTVLPEGGLITKHSSVFLDLKNRALVLRYMAIFPDESPLVPYQDWRRYVYGSTSGSVTVSGDVLGPIFPEIPLTVQGVMGMELKGTEASAFELANNIWTLHYLRLTNQLVTRFTRKVLEEVNVLLGEVMRRYNVEGWFRNWDTSAPSVWLTSWVIRTLKHGAFQDWEDYFYVQPEIFQSSVRWLLQYQSEEGYFNETQHYYYPLDPKTRAVSGNSSDPVILTAHVVITLHEVSPHVHGSLKTVAHTACVKAVRYLEHALSVMTDPYAIAITAYALTLSDSSEEDQAIAMVQNHGRELDGLLYWSRIPIPSNEIRYENQRPFLRPREHQEGDSLAVETTAYALLALLAWDGATIDAERVVQWLNGVRMSNNGFISSMDSAIGLQALTEYSFRARLLAVTDMTVNIDMPSSNKRSLIRIGNTSIGSEKTMEIPSVWGHVNVIARGSGQALAQMDVSFGIDYEALVETPILRCFELRFREFYSTFRNKSAITIESCMRWILQDPPVSGAAVLELEIPTGYHLLESEATQIAASGVHPTLRDGRTLEGKTAWYFDYIPQEWTCFNHTIRRWFPVANMTLYRQAMLYEEYARENFVHVLVNSTPLYILNICEVCGSYQCPYCPHYSSAMHCLSSIMLILCSVSVFLFRYYTRYTL